MVEALDARPTSWDKRLGALVAHLHFAGLIPHYLLLDTPTRVQPSTFNCLLRNRTLFLPIMIAIEFPTGRGG